MLRISDGSSEVGGDVPAALDQGGIRVCRSGEQS
jgi:hypothetical protein